MSTAESPPSPIHSPPATESQWAIAWRQFGKRRTAVWGLRGAVALVFIAIYCPVFCSGLPLVWSGPSGALEFPWFAKLFDQIYWRNEVDRFFNLLLVICTLWLLTRLGMRVFGGRRPTYAAIKKRVGRAFLFGTLLLVFAQMFGAPLINSSHPYVDYMQEHKQMQAAGTKHTAIFTAIPFGHREQGWEGIADRFRGPMDFGGRGPHLLGTDKKGRDVLARLVYGTRISLTVGIIAVAIYISIGLVMGGIAGYAGGKTDLLIMRLIEIILCVPGLFLILTIIALFNSHSIFMIMFAIGIVGWTGVARLVRGEFIRERGKDYVTAARSLGLSGRRILFKHIMPNAIGPVIVSATFGVAAAIITESTLSFLGLGDPSVPSWGQMLDVGRTDREWHMIAIPGIAIFITVTLLNLVGDGLRDAMDPRLRS